MTHERDINLSVTVNPRRVTRVAVAVLCCLAMIAIVIFRRDISVSIAPFVWWIAASVFSGCLTWIIIKLLRPLPLMRIDPSGVSFPGAIADTIRWQDIRKVETSNRRGRTGDINDRLIIHLKQPAIVSWLVRRKRVEYANVPQATLAIDLGNAWPMRADDVRILMKRSLLNFRSGSAQTERHSSPGAANPVIRAIVAITMAVVVPMSAHYLNVGLPRVFSVGLAHYQAGDIDAALPHLKTDARAGDPEAAFALGMLHLNGDGVARNPAMAVGWFSRAAKVGHGGAAFQMGTASRLGLGAPQDTEAAVTWYRIAAAEGTPEAAYALARMYRTGDGVRRDYARAIEWLEAAIADNYAPAAHDLGRLYHDGIAVPRDRDAAAKWYGLATQQKHVPATYDLARLLLDGPTQERIQGRAYLSTAAHAGFAPAQRRLAKEMLIEGDTAAAFQWITLAERAWPAATRADVVREKARIERALDAVGKSRALELIRQWKPRRS